MRLDLALIARHPELSRRKARDVIEKGQVQVDGQVVREAGTAVPAGARIGWDPHKKALPRVRSRIPLLLADDHLVVVDKPAGLLSVPTPGATAEDTALARVHDYARRVHPRAPFVGRVHRLDRDTSGTLLFALTAEARAVLVAQFKEHRITRRYAALVGGEPAGERGVVDVAIADVYEGGKRRLARRGEASSPARTHWRVLERLPEAALLELTLETGRQHQIRLHLAHVRLPVIGDLVYGGPRAARGGARRQMLHARHLTFVHPATGQPVQVESPLPPDFVDAMERLRRDRR